MRQLNESRKAAAAETSLGAAEDGRSGSGGHGGSRSGSPTASSTALSTPPVEGIERKRSRSNSAASGAGKAASPAPSDASALGTAAAEGEAIRADGLGDVGAEVSDDVSGLLLPRRLTATGLGDEEDARTDISEPLLPRVGGGDRGDRNGVRHASS